MKKFLLYIIIGTGALFCGCDKNNHCGAIWDFVNPDICFIVKNANGDNLMDPSFEGNILDNGIFAEYNGVIYELNSSALTRDSGPAMWEGLRAARYYGNDTIYLMFGEFKTETGDEGYHGEKFIIDWGDGTRDEVTFDLYITWKNCKPTVHKKVYINGELKSSGSLTVEIIK